MLKHTLNYLYPRINPIIYLAPATFTLADIADIINHYLANLVELDLAAIYSNHMRAYLVSVINDITISKKIISIDNMQAHHIARIEEIGDIKITPSQRCSVGIIRNNVYGVIYGFQDDSKCQPCINMTQILEYIAALCPQITNSADDRDYLDLIWT